MRSLPPVSSGVSPRCRRPSISPVRALWPPPEERPSRGSNLAGTADRQRLVACPQATPDSSITVTNNGAVAATIVGWSFRRDGRRPGGAVQSQQRVYTVVTSRRRRRRRRGIPLGAGGSVTIALTSKPAPATLPATPLSDTLTVFVQGPTGSPTPYTVNLVARLVTEGAVLTGFAAGAGRRHGHAGLFPARRRRARPRWSWASIMGELSAILTLPSPSPVTAGFSFSLASNQFPGQTASQIEVPAGQSAPVPFNAVFNAPAGAAGTTEIATSSLSFAGTPICQGGLTGPVNLALTAPVTAVSNFYACHLVCRFRIPVPPTPLLGLPPPICTCPQGPIAVTQACSAASFAAATIEVQENTAGTPFTWTASVKRLDGNRGYTDQRIGGREHAAANHAQLGPHRVEPDHDVVGHLHRQRQHHGHADVGSQQRHALKCCRRSPSPRPHRASSWRSRRRTAPGFT